MLFYVNGVSYPTSVIASSDSGGTPEDNAASTTIGIHADAVSSPFNGLIDEVEVFNRALTAEEIATIYNAGSAGKCRQCTPPPSGMVSWWPGDEAANDQVGTNQGTLVGNATYGAGMVGQAFSLDGSGDYVSVGDVDLPSTYTIDAWIKPDIVSTSQIMLRGGGGHVYAWFVFGDGRMQAEMSDGAGAVVVYRTTNPVITASAWQHVALTYDAAAGPGAKMLFYVNGSNVPVTVFADGGPTVNPTDPARVGEGLDGLIDEVEVFNRVLSASEIQAIYSARSAGKCKSCATPPSSMVSWWDGEGDANDLIGANHGTLVNGVTFAPGMVGQAFNFDGTNQHVEVPGAVGDFGSAAFSVDFWMYTSDTDVTRGHYILGKSYPDGGQGWDIRYYNTTITVEGWSFEITSSITLDTWHHIAVSATVSDITLYIDGVVKGTSGRPASITSTSNPFRIGYTTGFYPYTNIGFNGLIDEVEIFDRALTAEEIALLYQAGSAGKCKSVAAYTLQVEINPAGGGTVIDTGIACPGDCTEDYDDGTPVLLTAAPNPGYRVDSWTNCDTPSGNQCAMTMNADKTVIANFIRQYTLTVAIDGTGTGTGTVTDTGIACPGDCTEVYDANTPVALNQAANADSVFSGWSGDCDAGGNVTMTADKSCTATFNLINGPDLTGAWNPVTQTCKPNGKCRLEGAVRVWNQGNALAPGFQVRVLLSDDQIPGPEDMVLKTINVHPLLPGEDRTKAFRKSLPPGINASGKYVIADIDPLNVVPETIETNNRPWYEIP